MVKMQGEMEVIDRYHQQDFHCWLHAAICFGNWHLRFLDCSGGSGSRGKSPRFACCDKDVSWTGDATCCRRGGKEQEI